MAETALMNLLRATECVNDHMGLELGWLVLFSVFWHPLVSDTVSRLFFVAEDVI